MGEFADDLLDTFAELGDHFGWSAFTFADGSSTKAATEAAKVAFRKDLVRGSDPQGLDPDRVTYCVLASFFASGFSGAAPVPTAGQTITVTGEKAWTVAREQDSVRLVNGAIYVLRCSRRRQAGAA